jgi:beta-glucosidase
MNSPEHRALALTAAEQSMVLLKNDGLLPLAKGRLKVVVIGPLADSRRVLRGNYTNRDTAGVPSALDGLKAAMPDAQIRYVPAGESITDGDLVPASALQTEDGSPGVTVRYLPFKPDGKPAPTSLMEKFARAISAPVADVPSTTRVEPMINYELFTQPLLPDGGKSIARGIWYRRFPAHTVSVCAPYSVLFSSRTIPRLRSRADSTRR